MNRRTKNPTLFQQLKHEWLELDLACKSVNNITASINLCYLLLSNPHQDIGR